MSVDRTGAGPWPGFDGSAAAADRDAARRGNRRRLLVFGLTFLAAFVLGQAWNFSRPAEYRSSTRLQVDLPEVGRPGSSASAAYATRLQLFDSRPMLDRLAQDLAQTGVNVGAAGGDAAAALQSMLQVLPIPASEVVELRAVGSDPQLLAAMLNAYPEVIRKEIAARQAKDADAQLAAARQELDRLERTAGERRARLDAYRQRENVAAERDDNEAVARSKGLNKALDTAVEKEAAATAKLNAIAKAVEQGKTSTQVRVDPALSGLETRAHQTREDLKELERTYTPEFLAMDPRARAMRARLAELEAQIVRQRDVSLQAALQAAQEDQTSAQAQVERLRAQLREARPALTKTNVRFGEAKLLEDDLAQLDKARRELLERVSHLEADDARRVATVTVLEAASVPPAPFRPDRWRDGALVLAGATALALLVMGTVELFNRPPPVAPPASNTTVLVTPGWDPRRALGAAGAQVPPLLGTPPPGPDFAGAALAAPLRVLSQAEAAALLTASRGRSRWLCALALMGLSADEALAVRAADFDAGARRLNVRGAWARQLPVPAWLATALPQAAAGEQTVLQDAAGQPLTAADVASLIIGAALDARLDHAAGTSWQTLRDTAIDWLLGRGLRYSELPRVVGRVDAEKLQILSAGHAGTPPAELDGAELLMPALRLDPDPDA